MELCGLNLSSSNTLSIIKGDFFSCSFTLTNEDGSPLVGISSVIFTSKILSLEIQLNPTVLNPNIFILELGPEITSNFIISSQSTYDITVQLVNQQSPITAIRSARLEVLRKENPL